jgi:predicted hotdog family 3-hydroxylacyl-ACP dehydratase
MSGWNADLSEILPFVPHRPPMVWVDEIVKFDESSGECRVTIKKDAHFLGPDGLRPSSCLEFIAQAYGYCSMAYTRMKEPESGPLKRAFLASFKDATFTTPDLMGRVKEGDQLQIKFFGVRQIGPITMFNGQALHDGEILCETQMKVFCES